MYIGIYVYMYICIYVQLYVAVSVSSRHGLAGSSTTGPEPEGAGAKVFRISDSS